MLTSWLTFLAVLAGSAGPGRAAIGRSVVTVRPTCRVKGHSGASQTLRCGDGKNPGVVEYWHTPFGDFQSSRFHSDLDPVFMHPDSSLVIPNSSGLHSGLYYCLLRQTQGTTLWPYELNVHDHGGRQDGSSGDPMRFRRDVGSKEEELVADPDRQFAAAVASSVLLTFVLGFTAGALSRTHVLRCLGAVAKRLRLTRQKRRQIETGDPGDEVTMVTVPSMYDNHAFQVEEELYETQETTSSHPDEPQKNVQHQQEEQRETTTYLEGCDYRQEEEKRLEEEEEEEKGQFGGFYLIGEDGGSETEEEKCSEDKEEEESREEKKERRREEEEDRNEEAERGSQEKWRGEKVEEEGQRKEKRREGDEETDISSDSDGEPDRKQDGGQEPPSSSSSSSSLSSPSSPASPASPSSPASPPRRSRIIRLYQYDEDGQRYCHLSDPAPSDTGPTPRLKQRSLSLTRLNTIMAAASAGPLDTSQRERETKEREGRPHFHLEI